MKGKANRREWLENLFHAGNWCIKKNSGQQVINYCEYDLSIKEWILYFAEGAAAAAVFVYVFYRKRIVFLISLIFLIFYPLWKRKKLIEKRKKKLLLEFKDTILAMAAAMGAGYAVENALKEAADEVRLLHGTDSLMVKEMEDMIHKIHLNQQVECLLLDLGRRSQLEEIENFAQVFAAAKRSGGELVKIIDRTARIIGESIRVENEIEVLTAAKRYEQKIMNGMPLFLVLYMDLTSPGFFQVLYDTWLGRIIMTGCLIVYVLAVYLAERIIRIKM